MFIHVYIITERILKPKLLKFNECTSSETQGFKGDGKGRERLGAGKKGERRGREGKGKGKPWEASLHR